MYSCALCEQVFHCYQIGNKQSLSVLSTAFEHDRVGSSTPKNVRARDVVLCSNVFISPGNSPGVLKTSIEHAQPLFNCV